MAVVVLLPAILGMDDACLDLKFKTIKSIVTVGQQFRCNFRKVIVMIRIGLSLCQTARFGEEP